MVREDKESFKLSYLCGLIAKEDEIRFKRMVFRVSKGNVFTIVEDREAQINEQEEIIDPKSVKFLRSKKKKKFLVESSEETSFFVVVSWRDDQK